MVNQNENQRLRELLEKASQDFSSDNFSDELLVETKELIKKLGGSIINYFIQNQSFGITQPEDIGNNFLKFKVQSNLGIMFLTIDQEGNFKI